MTSRDGEHFVNIDVTHAGTRYHFEGPRREDVAKAQEDLTYIYSAAATGATRAEGLQAMKAAAKALRDEAKAAAKNVRAATQATTRGSVQNEGATGHYARIQYLEDSKQREVTGTRPFKGVSSICILVTQIHILSELGPWSAMVGDGLRIRA